MEVSSYDPLAPETVDDPFPAYSWLREQCPVHRTDQFGHPLYTLSRRADVHAVLTDPWSWSNQLGPGVGYAGVERRGDIQRFDPPEHTARRKFARREFNPVETAKTEPTVREIAHRTAAEMVAAGPPFELHDGFALTLPILAFIDMMGVDEEDRANIKAWADEMVQGLSDPYIGGQGLASMKRYPKTACRRPGEASTLGPGCCTRTPCRSSKAS
jgi:cytochrome P450 family 130